jgi:hypothetical protein
MKGDGMKENITNFSFCGIMFGTPSRTPRWLASDEWFSSRAGDVVEWGLRLFQVALDSRQAVKREEGRKGKVGDWIAITRIVNKEKLYQDTVRTHQCTKGFLNIIHCDARLRSSAPRLPNFL